MNALNFVLTLALTALGPIVALRYLQPILLRVLQGQGPEGGDGADFWMRSAYVLAVCGTLLLGLSFGEYRYDLLATLERALWLVCAGTFGTVAFIARQVWAPVRRVRQREQFELNRQLAAAGRAQEA